VQKELGLIHPKVGLYQNNLGELYRQQGDLQSAEIRFKQALSISEQTLGGEDVEVADILFNLGAVAQQRGMKEEARHHWIRGQKIIELKLGADHPKYELYASRLVQL